MNRVAFLLVVLLAASPAAAQGLTMLSPMAPSYSLNGFTYEPPKGEGWRELASAPDALRIVYAEQITADQINTRADFGAQAFPIPEPEKAPNAEVLARLSLEQRTQEKGKDLVAMSAIEPVDGAQVPMFQYTIVTKVEQEDYYETYFIALAPDKSEYFAGKLVTKDHEFRDQAYYAVLRASMAGMKFAAAEKPASAEPPPAPASPEPPQTQATPVPKTPDK